SLPWRGGAFGTALDYDIAKLPADTYDVLLKSDDVLVHMETLRRAVVYVTGMDEKRERPSIEQRETLLTALMGELQYDADMHADEAKAACSNRQARSP